MKHTFEGWPAVAACLERRAGDVPAERLNAGQRASLRAIADRLPRNGVLVADEVGMGKTRISVEVARCVTECGGRVAILVPPGLGYQWLAELRDGDLMLSRGLLRSLGGFLDAWSGVDRVCSGVWFDDAIVLISHAFTNWRLGESAAQWRWTLLPELYAHSRKTIEGRWPRFYKDNDKLSDPRVRRAASSICATIAESRSQPAYGLIERLIEETPWPDALASAEYARNESLRPWLERAVGLGLGVFDLVVIDEAHKSRGEESGLSRLLSGVILQSAEGRRLAMTATPVELDERQWQQTLGRVGLRAEELKSLTPAIENYAKSVRHLRHAWRTSLEARSEYQNASAAFQEALSPYLLRRDKREDSAVRLFAGKSRLPIHEYRRETEIAIVTSELPLPWQQAVCAAEALSIVAPRADDPIAKRLRLTLGNGHGVASLLDQVKHDDNQDQRQGEYDLRMIDAPVAKPVLPQSGESKRGARAAWWRGVIESAFASSASGDAFLFEHPALLAAVDAIEAQIHRGEKVLVFGRFTRPLRALVDLLNAREMLRRIQDGRQSWPKSKVHGSRDGNMDNSEWPAVVAAHRQLQSSIDLGQLDQALNKQYEQERREREKLRDRIVELVESGLSEIAAGQRAYAMLRALKDAATRTGMSVSSDERHPVVLVARALTEHVVNSGSGPKPSEWAKAFCDLIEAATDRDEGDSDGDGQLDPSEAAELWKVVEGRLHEEYNRPQGGFARLMYGETRQESRRMIQLAFNRPNSFPRVLVAQSLVGREGLNLHTACRIVVLLHPEWNPGVVEQQIGRVDRVGSHWAKLMNEWSGEDEIPRIEVRPVVFRGTYDEHNWHVLRERWDDHRAQLHGIVVPIRVAEGNSEDLELIDELTQAAPNFSPTPPEPIG